MHSRLSHIYVLLLMILPQLSNSAQLASNAPSSSLTKSFPNSQDIKVRFFSYNNQLLSVGIRHAQDSSQNALETLAFNIKLLEKQLYTDALKKLSKDMRELCIFYPNLKKKEQAKAIETLSDVAKNFFNKIPPSLQTKLNENHPNIWGEIKLFQWILQKTTAALKNFTHVIEISGTELPLSQLLTTPDNLQDLPSQLKKFNRQYHEQYNILSTLIIDQFTQSGAELKKKLHKTFKENPGIRMFLADEPIDTSNIQSQKNREFILTIQKSLHSLRENLKALAASDDDAIDMVLRTWEKKFGDQLDRCKKQTEDERFHNYCEQARATEDYLMHKKMNESIPFTVRDIYQELFTNNPLRAIGIQEYLISSQITKKQITYGSDTKNLSKEERNILNFLILQVLQQKTAPAKPENFTIQELELTPTKIKPTKKQPAKQRKKTKQANKKSDLSCENKQATELDTTEQNSNDFAFIITPIQALTEAARAKKIELTPFIKKTHTIQLWKTAPEELYKQRNITTAENQSKTRREHSIPIEKLCENRIHQILHAINHKSTDAAICKQFAKKNMIGFITRNDTEKQVTLTVLVPACTKAQDTSIDTGVIEICYNITGYLQGTSTTVTRFHTWFIPETTLLASNFHKQFNIAGLLTLIDPQDINQECTTIEIENKETGFTLKTDLDGWAKLNTKTDYTIIIDPTTNPEHFKWIACPK